MRGDLNRLWDALTPLPGGCPMPEAKQIRRAGPRCAGTRTRRKGDCI